MTGEGLVDAVLFDLGNVLVGWDPFLAYQGRCPRAEVQRFFTTIDFMGFNHEQDAGRTWADAREALARTHPEYLSMLDVYIANFADSVTGDLPGAARLVADVQATGVQTFGLTNWSAETFHVALRKTTVVGALADVVVSGREMVAKPDPRIFDLAVSRFGLDPARTLFTDDAEQNVRVAAGRGLRTHHFQGPAGLRAQLRAFGVDVPEEAAT